MLFNVTCRELPHQMGWSSSFSMCRVCRGLVGRRFAPPRSRGTGRRRSSDAASLSRKLIWNSSAFTCCRLHRGSTTNWRPPLLGRGCPASCPADSCLWWENCMGLCRAGWDAVWAPVAGREHPPEGQPGLWDHQHSGEPPAVLQINK